MPPSRPWSPESWTGFRRPPSGALVGEIRRRHGASVAAILFYGSCRRTGDLSGLIDLYVLHDGHRRFHGRILPALLNRILPPNVLFLTVPHGPDRIRAKVAMLSRRQFARRMRPGSLDTTLWARFSQPATLLHARDPATRRWLETTLAAGLRTAGLWALRLGPDDATPAGYWHGLFAHTYGAELRPEGRDRPAQVYEADSGWFDAGLALTLAGLGMDPAPDAAGMLHPDLPHRRRWRMAWTMMRVLGRLRNILRLVKAGLTVENGADYLVWKIERHSGRALVLSRWQRRHPVLAAPAVLWRLRRSGAIR